MPTQLPLTLRSAWFPSYNAVQRIIPVLVFFSFVSYFFHLRAGAITATHVGTAVVLLNKTPFVPPRLPVSDAFDSLSFRLELGDSLLPFGPYLHWCV